MERILIQRRASQVREILKVDLHSPIDLFSLITTDTDITLVFYPFKDNISGMCIKSANLIAINSKSTFGRKIFSLAHELYHYYFDDGETTISYFENNYQSNKFEKDANLFASYLLMPDTTLTSLVEKLTDKLTKKIDIMMIMEIEQYFKVSRKAVLTRLMMENYIKSEDEPFFSIDIIKNAKKFGYDISLYTASKDILAKTFGSYLKKALKLKNDGLISDGKYEEYLLEAYRSDIVFDENGDSEIYD